MTKFVRTTLDNNDVPPSDGLIDMIETLRDETKDTGRRALFEQLCDFLWDRLTDLRMANDGDPDYDFNETVCRLFGPDYDVEAQYALKNYDFHKPARKRSKRRQQKPAAKLLVFKKPDPPDELGT